MTTSPAARPVALTVAGSDSSGGAGISADLKTFEALGVWGASAITAVTAQNSQGVKASLVLPPWLVAAQIDAVSVDVRVQAAKTGMLGSAEVVHAVARALKASGIPRLVVDPVVMATQDDRLLDADALTPLREELLPLATVVTPNLAEAATLTGLQVADRDGMVAAAEALHRLGPTVVLLTGGHLPDRARSPDLMWTAGGPRWLQADRVDAVHTHGSGCVLSAAVAAGLARGRDPIEACRRAKEFVTGAIHAGFPLGAGPGPVDPGLGPGTGKC
jgi:hydroxymethylpyrimidine/phosphomethylpyrimidine kinase